MSRQILHSIIAVLFCCCGALPSILWSMDFDLAGRLAGIGVFAAAYAIVPHTLTFKALWSKRRMRLAIQIGYGVRTGISLGFPVGMMIDLMPGLWSMSITGMKPTAAASAFELVFATTLLQGAFLHMILGCFIGIVYGVMAWFNLQGEDTTGRGFEVILPGNPVQLPKAVRQT